VHVPEPLSVIVAPFEPPDVHTEVVVVLNVTTSPDDAVATTAKVGSVTLLPGSAANEIVCAAGLTLNVRVIGAAASVLASPA
jgi:hypothetical protein